MTSSPPVIEGFGLGLRPDHYASILEERPAVDWFEVLSENYMVAGGKPLHFLDRVRSEYPVVMHGVSMSIGSTQPLDLDYLRELKRLAERINPAWISDHLCWTGVAGKNMHDLLPLPYTEEAIGHVVERVAEVQEFLGQPILLENVSSYVTWTESTVPEWEFLTEVVGRTGCGLLLDVNNVYVSSQNHGFNALEFLKGVPAGSVRQIHLAGHSRNGDLLIDTHDHPVPQAVWDLYAETVALLGDIPTMIERDANIPPLGELLDELSVARRISQDTREAAA